MKAEVPRAHGSHKAALYLWLPILILVAPEAQPEKNLCRQIIWEMTLVSRCQAAERERDRGGKSIKSCVLKVSVVGHSV